MKRYRAGGAFEQLLRFSGLSPSHQDRFHHLGHCRKNRRFLSQVAAAKILRIEDALKSMFPDLSVYIKSLKDQVAAERTALRETSFEGRKKFLKSGERLSEIKNSMPPGAELAVSSAVSPNMFEISKTLYDNIKSISKHSINMKFYGFQLLLCVSIPWTGYNILTRKAQTNIVDRFYFRFLGLMHGTKN